MTLESEYLHGRRKPQRWHGYYRLFSGLLIGTCMSLVFVAGLLLGLIVGAL